MEEKVYNPISKRFISVYGNRYKQLIKSGYYVNAEGILTKKPESIFNSKILHNIVTALTPNDLLSLYLTNKQDLFTQAVLFQLSNLYGIEPVTSFPEFIKLYNLSIIDPYLYELENNIEMPSPVFIAFFRRQGRHTSEDHRDIEFNWILEVNTQLKTGDYVSGLTMTLFDAYISKIDILEEDLRTLTVVCHYLACNVLVEDIPSISDYIYYTDGNVDKEKFLNFRTHVINILNGIIIRPSVIFFLDMNNIYMKNLALLSFLQSKLMIYKPSIIAEAIQYIVTKTYKIYSLVEINKICSYLIPLISRISTSSLTSFKNIATRLAIFTNYEYIKEKVAMATLQFKYHNEWHVGEYEKLDKISSGSYGKVVKIKRKLCNQDFVIKENLHVFEPALLELSILKLLSNKKSIIPLCDFNLTKERVELYLPFMDIDLEKLILTNQFDHSKFSIYAKQMLQGLSSCHHCDIIHRDIKIENIVYQKKEDTFKLIDFGLSVPYASIRKNLSPSIASTFVYRAPEALFELNYNYKIDIWALGCVFYYIFTKSFIISDIAKLYSDALNDIFKLFGTPANQEWPGIETLINNNHINNYVKNEYYLRKVFGDHYTQIMPFFILNPENRTSTKDLLKLF